MDLPMYDVARKLINQPNDAYLNQLQALINNRWENSTQTSHNIYQETDIGTNEFVSVDVSVDTAIDIGTGFKKGDDFKVFSHRDISVTTPLGTMFKSDNDYWVCINTNGFASPTNSIEVRRCNNIMKWVDRSNGYVNQQWCAIDYELSSPQPLKDKDIIVANGHIFVIVQGNDVTRAIEKNQRFIFNGQPYKVMGIQSLLDDSATIQYPTLLYIDMYLDTIQPSDDMVNNIANATDYIYTVELQPDVDKQCQGFSGRMTASVLFNGSVTDKEIVWSGNKYVEVGDDGSYTLIGESGDTAIISAYIKDNQDSMISHSISIVDSVEDNYDIVITPLFGEVRQKQPLTFSVYLYKNGVQQEDAVEWSYSGLTDNYFTMFQDGHIFTLSVKNISKTPLSLTFRSGGISETIDVMLKPFF